MLISLQCHNTFIHTDVGIPFSSSLETSPPPVGSPYWSPPSVASLQNKMREEGIKREEILREMGVPNTSLQRQKVSTHTQEILGGIPFMKIVLP